MRKLIRNYWENNGIFIASGLTTGVLVAALVKPGTLPVPGFHLSDKFLHLLAFAVLTIAWFFSYGNHKKTINFFWISGLLLLYGIIIEILQSVIHTGRTADWKDVVADVAGIATGWIVFPPLVKYLYKQALPENSQTRKRE